MSVLEEVDDEMAKKIVKYGEARLEAGIFISLIYAEVLAKFGVVPTQIGSQLYMLTKNKKIKPKRNALASRAALEKLRAQFEADPNDDPEAYNASTLRRAMTPGSFSPRIRSGTCLRATTTRKTSPPSSAVLSTSAVAALAV